MQTRHTTDRSPSRLSHFTFKQCHRNCKPVHVFQGSYDTSTDKRYVVKRTCWGEGSVCARRRRFLWSLGLSSIMLYIVLYSNGRAGALPLGSLLETLADLSACGPAASRSSASDI